SGELSRVLLLAPSYNFGAAEFCRDNNPWARFADAHGLILVVPEFMTLTTEAILPQQWAGPATLAALVAIKKQYPIHADQLLIHGYGNGAEFAERFALWKPELCAAVSIHSAVDWAWQESMPED